MLQGTAVAPIPKKNIFYPASYLVMTVTSLLFLGSVSGLGALLIHYWLNGVSSSIDSALLIYWMASLLVVLPLHLLAYRQVRHTDKSLVTPFSMRVAHGLLGAYLLVTVGSVIVLSTWLLAIWLNVPLGTGKADRHLLATSLSLLQAIAWAAYVTWHFQRSRLDQSRPRYYIMTLSSLSLLVFLASLIFPAPAYRGVAQDATKEADLARLQMAIGDYVDIHNALPAKLSDLKNIDDEMAYRLADYQYSSHGQTKFGIFGYELCATFARNNDKGRDTAFGFASHGAGRQCFVRTTISFSLLQQDLAQAANNEAAKLRAAIQSFLLGTQAAINRDITGVEAFAGGQVKQLEGNLEGLEGGMTELEQEMQRLQGNLNGLQGDTGQLAQDFAAVEKFLHDLGCLFGGCTNP